MNLEYVIRSRWKDTSSLNSAIPVKYVVFGSNPYKHIPRAIIQFDKYSVSVRTNIGVAGKNMTVEFVIADTNYQNLSSIADNVIETYEGVQFEISENRALATMKFANLEFQQNDSIWTATIHFETRMIYC